MDVLSEPSIGDITLDDELDNGSSTSSNLLSMKAVMRCTLFIDTKIENTLRYFRRIVFVEGRSSAVFPGNKVARSGLHLHRSFKVCLKRRVRHEGMVIHDPIVTVTDAHDFRLLDKVFKVFDKRIVLRLHD